MIIEGPVRTSVEVKQQFTAPGWLANPSDQIN